MVDVQLQLLSPMVTSQCMCPVLGVQGTMELLPLLPLVVSHQNQYAIRSAAPPLTYYFYSCWFLSTHEPIIYAGDAGDTGGTIPGGSTLVSATMKAMTGTTPLAGDSPTC